jgi:multiple sugar transport system permease protein
MTIFLAGLRQIPESLLEAARIDGANALQRFWRIRLPLITPVLFFNIVLQTVHSFQSFTAAHMISGGTGGPRDSTLLFPLYLYERAFVRYDMGYAAGMAWILLLVIAAFTAFYFATARFWVFYGE